MPSRASLLLVSALAMAGCDRQAAAPEQASVAPDEVAAAPAPAVKAGTLDRSHRGEPAPAAAFIAPDGGQVRLADFRGRPLLVNLWATWCAPCVAELPTLDAAAGKPGRSLRVLTVSQDLDETPATATRFLGDRGFKRLEPYRDPKLALGTAYGANLPATVLYDAAGREVWRRLGGFDWDSSEADQLIAEAG